MQGGFTSAENSLEFGVFFFQNMLSNLGEDSGHVIKPLKYFHEYQTKRWSEMSSPTLPPGTGSFRANKASKTNIERNIKHNANTRLLHPIYLTIHLKLLISDMEIKYSR